MELKRIRYFRSVVEADGLTKAARALDITPGTLSKALRQLETDLDVDLFARVGRGLELTDAGRTLYNASDRVIDEYARMLRTITQERRPTSSTLRIASFEVFTTHVLGELIKGELEDVAVRVSDVSVAEIGQVVARREADVGLTYVPYLQPEVEFRRLVRFEFGIFVRRGAFADVPVADIPFTAPITGITGGATQMVAVDSWPADRVQRRIKYHLTNLESGLELVRRGLCAVFLPVFVAGLHNQTVKPACQLARVPNPARMKAVHQTVHLVTRPEDDGPQIKRFAKAVREAVDRGASLGASAATQRR